MPLLCRITHTVPQTTAPMAPPSRTTNRRTRANGPDAFLRCGVRCLVGGTTNPPGVSNSRAPGTGSEETGFDTTGMAPGTGSRAAVGGGGAVTGMAALACTGAVATTPAGALAG